MTGPDGGGARDRVARDEPPPLPCPPQKRSALKRWRALLARIPREADLVLVGDSLAAGWPGDLLAAALPKHRAFNFGLPGDRVANTLWRLREADLAGLAPRAALVLVGTNDLGDGAPPERIAAGLAAVLSLVRFVWPGTSVVLATLPPRGAAPGFREAERASANALLGRLVERLPAASLLPIDRLLSDGGLAPVDILEPDRLHLNRRGYELLTAGLTARLRR